MSELNERLHEHLHYAYAHTPAVKFLFEQAGLTPDDIQDVNDLPRLPVTNKDQFTQMQQQSPPFGGWLAIPIEDLDRIYISPGPIYDPFSADDDALLEDAAVPLRRAGFGRGDIVVNTFMYHMVPAGMLLDDAVRRTGATVVPLGPGNTEVQVKAMMELRVNGYVGTPSFLSIILDKAAALGVPHEAIPLEKAFFTAEPYPPSLRAKFEGEYGMVTIQAYATADLGVIAYEVPGEEGLVFAENQVVELVDPETGQLVEDGTPGEVVVTKFDRTYPLLRFGTGDMAVMIPGTGRLRGLVGRSGEAIKVRGMFLHPNQIRFTVGAFEGIQAAQAVITRDGARDYVTVRVVKQPGANISADMLQQALSNAARLSINAIEFVDTIDEGARMIDDQRTWE